MQEIKLLFAISHVEGKRLHEPIRASSPYDRIHKRRMKRQYCLADDRTCSATAVQKQEWTHLDRRSRADTVMTIIGPANQ